METKGVFLSFCLCVLLITCTDAARQNCCVGTFPLKRGWMKSVCKIDFQHSGGSCDINAGILHLKDQKIPICIDFNKAKMLQKFKNEKRPRLWKNC